MKSSKRDYLTFYRSYYEAIQDLKDVERLQFYEAIMSYMFDDIELELDGITKTIFNLIKPTLAKSKQNSKNGSKGGAPIGNKNANKQKTSEF